MIPTQRATRFVDYLRLPEGISAFERSYLARMNRIALVFFLLHPPVIALVAWANGMSAPRAFLYSCVALVGPFVAYRLENPRTVSMVMGVTSMLMGGLLVHFGQGPMQIEMHFYFFVLLALQAMFANPAVIVASALTAATHHLVLFYLLPSSVFNYRATLLTVIVHAIFVVLESAAACFVARSFFDDVIGLDALVQTRTSELDAKNRDLQLVLDSVQQGLVMIDLGGRVCGARSAAFDRWFPGCEPGRSWVESVASVSPSFSQWLALGLDDVASDILPRELTLAQLPTELTHGDCELRLDYLPIERNGALTHLLVVVTDATASIARAVAEREDRELAILLERHAKDPAGVTEFVEDASALAAQIVDGDLGRTERLRAIHTLKGNAGVFGLGTVAAVCHEVESRAADGDGDFEADTSVLARSWASFRARLDPMMKRGDESTVRVPNEDLLETVEAAAQGLAPAELARRLLSWTREPVAVRFERMATQAGHLAARLGKETPEVRVEDHGIRLPRRRFAPLWSALVHAVRNAVDHGLETSTEREAVGKPAHGVIVLGARRESGVLEIVVRDDGRGIDWDKVRESAIRKGLPHETALDLEAAVFADGVSSRAEVTDVSGRGVGMSALLDAVRRLNGDLRLQSERGRGTTLVLRVPLAESDLHVELEAARRSLWPAAA